MLSPTKIARTIKSITARELFDRHPEMRKLLWSGSFWTSGFYINTVGRSGNEDAIKNYVKHQGRNYKQLHREEPEQQSLFM